MKLSKYIEKLQAALKNDGDLECVYATDENRYLLHKVICAGSHLYFENLDEYYLERADVEELDDYPDAVKAFCIN